MPNHRVNLRHGFGDDFMLLPPWEDIPDFEDSEPDPADLSYDLPEGRWIPSRKMQD